MWASWVSMLIQRWVVPEVLTRVAGLLALNYHLLVSLTSKNLLIVITCLATCARFFNVQWHFSDWLRTFLPFEFWWRYHFLRQNVHNYFFERFLGRHQIKYGQLLAQKWRWPCCVQHVASFKHPVARCCMKFEPNQTSCNMLDDVACNMLRSFERALTWAFWPSLYHILFSFETKKKKAMHTSIRTRIKHGLCPWAQLWVLG